MDRRRDYLDYLRPFLLQTLTVYSPEDRFSPADVSRQIRDLFGLKIPERTAELVLRRLSRSLPLIRDSGVYRVTGNIPDPNLTIRQQEAQQHIDAIVFGLLRFSMDSPYPFQTTDEAVEAIMAFLAEFDVSCLRAYLQNTVIPPLHGSHTRSKVMVSNFVRRTQTADASLFQSFVVLVQGHMLANALVCPDLDHVTQDYRSVTFYLDTPILVRLLGLEGNVKQSAVRELIMLLMNLQATVAVFEHSIDELRNVILRSAEYLDSALSRTPIILEARRVGRTRSDLLLAAHTAEDYIGTFGVDIRRSPSYSAAFQIDESLFEEVLGEWIDYRNPRARLYDINSVRSIYTLRERRTAPSLERAGSIFVTNNSSFAKAAWAYGQRYGSSQDVSSVISDFTIANAAWLKAPLGAQDVPRTQLLSFAYAALEPSPELLDKYAAEIDRLDGVGKFSSRDLELLRSDPRVYPELMGLTLGDEETLDTETVTDTLQRVSNSIRAEEQLLLTEEQQAHVATQEALDLQERRNGKLIEGIYWRANKLARLLAWVISVGLTVVLLIGLLVGLSFQMGWLPSFTDFEWPVITVLVVLTLAAVLNLVLGLSIKGLHGIVQNILFRWLVKMESKSLGTDLSEYSSDIS